MRHLFLAAACLLLVAAGPRRPRPAPAPPAPAAAESGVVVHGPAGAAAEILAAERAFASRSQEAGAGAAFAEFLDAEDSRAFMGGDPVRGAQAIGLAHAGPGKLAWWPSEVFAAKAGDMGVAWGRFHFVPPQGEPFDGRYVTVWRKTAKGGWKGIIDIGTPDREPAPAA